MALSCVKGCWNVGAVVFLFFLFLSGLGVLGGRRERVVVDTNSQD